ncbi:MAG: hypothetical protein RLY20_554 [Verrucomicrobiota bacterium]
MLQHPFRHEIARSFCLSMGLSLMVYFVTGRNRLVWSVSYIFRPWELRIQSPGDGLILVSAISFNRFAACPILDLSPRFVSCVW